MPILLLQLILQNNLKVTVGLELNYQVEPDEDYNEIITSHSF